MNKGFSLVELIVVIAIMAILVGVAVPVYTSYIDKANDAKDIQAIDNLEHACKIVSAEYSIKITFDEKTVDNKNYVTATLDNTNANFAKACAQLNKIVGAGTDGVYTIEVNTLPSATGDDINLPTALNPAA